MTPAWILDIFAAIMLVVAGVSAGRLVAGRAWSRTSPDTEIDIDAAHILMGIAMAGMLASGLQTLPNGAWVAVFAVVTAWFGWRVIAETSGQVGVGGKLASHHLPHLIHGGAMTYMFAAFTPAMTDGVAHTASPTMAGMGGASGMGTLSAPTIGLVFVILMAAWAVWDVDQTTSYARRRIGQGAAAAGGPARLSQQVALAAAGTIPAPAAGTLASGAGGASVPASQPTAGGQPAADARGTGAPVTRVLLDARVATTCRIAMGVTMALMLVLMI